MDKGENEEDKSRDKSQEKGASSERQNKKNQISIWEWIVAFAGFILVGSAIGFLLFKGLAVKESPPEVNMQITSIVRLNNGYLVRFHILNEGEMTAEGVVVEAELRDGEEKIENSQTTVDFLPAHSVRKGGFFFQNDPRQYKLQMRAVGYQEP